MRAASLKPEIRTPLRCSLACAVLLASSTAGVAAPNNQPAPPPEAKRPAQGQESPDSKESPKAKLPSEAALASASTLGGALALWASFSPVFRERMQRAPRRTAAQVIGVLNGADMTVEGARTDEFRRIALAQIQGVCAVFLTTPGIDFSSKERDLIAAYAARAGLLLNGEEKARSVPRR
jgi:hypothetical protein